MPEMVLLTGASGFIGGVVARMLKSRGYAIRAVSRQPATLDSRFDETASLPDLKTLNYRADDLVLPERWLVGRHFSNSDFRDWYWGGTIYG